MNSIKINKLKRFNSNNIVLFMTDKRDHINTINNAIDKNILKCNVAGCVTNKINTYNYINKNFDIPSYLIKWDKKNESRYIYEKRIIEKIQYLNPNILLLTGWKHIFTNYFINNFNHIINIHPALPNSYIGLNCIEKAYNDYKINKIDYSGLMIHYITEELDRGHVLEYRKVPILKNDTLDKLTERFRIYEKEPIINSLQKISKLQIHLDK